MKLLHTIAALVLICSTTAFGNEFRAGTVDGVFKYEEKVETSDQFSSVTILDEKGREKVLKTDGILRLVVVKMTLKKGFSIGAKDYVLHNNGAFYRCEAIAPEKGQFDARLSEIKAIEDNTKVSLLFRIPMTSEKIDLVYAFSKRLQPSYIPSDINVMGLPVK